MLCTALATLALTSPQYSPTPFGPVLSHCVHEVPNGAHLSERPDGRVQVSGPDGVVTILPACDTVGGKWPVRVRAASLPPNYDGWLQYTELNVSDIGLHGSFDQFTSVMSVPDHPKRRADVLYFFPGLQNMDWIPLVDPEPTTFDIIQPVLQYPSSGWRGGWGLRSWDVTLHAGAMFSRMIDDIQPGDAIMCNMTRTGAQSWRVSGALRSDPRLSTVQEATSERLQEQPWAYSAVAECYGCHGCDTYPTKPIVFSENKLYQAGKLVDVPSTAWKRNPKPAKKLMCNEATVVAPSGDATISFV